MRKNPSILRCIAFLLLLVFTQKAGAGLFIHNVLHSPSGKAHGESSSFNYSCTCGDDFLMPFTAAEEVSYAEPLQAAIEVVYFYQPSRVSSPLPLSSLRGPPFFTV